MKMKLKKPIRSVEAKKSSFILWKVRQVITAAGVALEMEQEMAADKVVAAAVPGKTSGEG